MYKEKGSMKMEFRELIKEFDRMCAHYEDPKENPFFKETLCEDWEEWYMNGAYEPEKFEEIVMKWVQKHPRPIYPTFRELIRSMIGVNDEREIEEVLDSRIPDEAAEKFGIVPINECGLNKYTDESSEWR